MSQTTMTSFSSRANDEAAVRALYLLLLRCWNEQNAAGMASLFAPDGNMIGFDGSAVDGRTAIEAHLRPIFADHPTALYVPVVRSVRLISRNVAVVRADAGMIPRGQSELNAAANATHTLVAARRGKEWAIAVFQNTPAAYHGRPEMSEALTNELRAAMQQG